MLKPALKELEATISTYWRRLAPNPFMGVIRSAALGLLILFLLTGVIWWWLGPDMGEVEQKLKGYQPRLATRILDRRGELLTELFSQQRLIVSVDSIPTHTINALLITEDARFRDHWGVDVVRVGAAAWVDVSTLSLRQGASTITQQLSRDLFYHKKRTFKRKIQEILMAIQIERNYSKDEILEMYLTQIYFGHGVYGIEAAARKYFNKSTTELTVPQSALLAALPKAPEYYSPLRRPEKAVQRRNLILGLMRDHGAISEQEYIHSITAPLEVAKGSVGSSWGTAPYFTEMIRQELYQEAKRLGKGEEELGFDYLTDGLTVNTTLDARLQRFAEAALDSHYHDLQSAHRRRFVERHPAEAAVALYGSSALNHKGESLIPLDSLLNDSQKIDLLFPRQAVLQAALIALDPRSGDILALIGGVDFAKYKYNRAVQAVRQPGSVFKPIVFTAAIDNGYSPCFELLNQDVVLTLLDGTRWTPHNYDYSHGGMTTLREALRRSLNLVTVRLVQEVVPPSMVVKYARQLGISSYIAPYDAVALGSSGVRPMEITAAFAAFANGGILCTPQALTAVEDRFGTEIIRKSPEQRVALSAQTAYIITDMLRTAIDRGTGAAARWKYEFYATAAGKTGTTNDFTDAWFVGYTPRLICGVWVGLDNPEEQLGEGQSGAVVALPIWARFMRMAYDNLSEYTDEPFPMPAGVVRTAICSQTKQLASPYCPQKSEELFLREMAPTDMCRKHRRM